MCIRIAAALALEQSPRRIAGVLFQRSRGVPLGMSKIHPECADSDLPDRLVADVLLRQEPDEEEDEEEDDGDGKEDDDNENEDEDDGYSE